MSRVETQINVQKVKSDIYNCEVNQKRNLFLKKYGVDGGFITCKICLKKVEKIVL